MNILTKEMRRSLKEMDLGLKGKNKSIIGVILTSQRSAYQDGPHGQSFTSLIYSATESPTRSRQSHGGQAEKVANLSRTVFTGHRFKPCLI